MFNSSKTLKFLLSLLWYIWLFYRDSTYILLTRDVILMIKEVPLYHQMNGGIHMNQLVTGKFIALKRKQKNLTQEQLAEKLGVSNKTISKWETGKSLPDIVSILNLSDLYQISLDELLKGDTKMKEKIEKDVKVAKDNKRLILTTAILLVVVAIIYSISAFVGGVFYDFCEAAVRWVVLSIGVAFALTYMSQKDKVISEKKGV